MKIKIYLACGLTYVPSEVFTSYMKFIEKMGNELSNQGYSVKSVLTVKKDPKTPKITNSNDCYLTYKKNIEKANLIIADATYPSTGVGIELQIATSNNIPIIVLYKKNNPIELKTYQTNQGCFKFICGEDGLPAMLKGLPSLYNVLEYSSTLDAIEKTLFEVKKLNLA